MNLLLSKRQESTYGIVLICRFLQGWGILWLVGVNSTTAWFPPSQRGFASGIASTGNAIGTGCGGLLVTLLMQIAGDWQGAFRIFGIILAIGAVIWAFLMRNPPEDLYPEDTITETVSTTSGKAVNPYKTVAAWLCAFCMIALLWQCVGFMSIGGTFMATLGYSSAQGATIILVVGLIGIVAPIVCGAVSDSLGKKMEPLRARVLTQAVFFAIAVVSTAAFPFVAKNSYLAALILSILVGNTQGVNATIGSLPLDLLNNQESANKMFSLTCLVGLGGGGMIAPLIASSSMENWGGTNAMFVLAFGALLGLLVTIILPKFKLRKD